MSILIMIFMSAVLHFGLWSVYNTGHGGALHPWTGAVICGLWVAEILQGLLIMFIAWTTVKYWLSLSVLGVLLCPLALYYRLWQRACVKLEPALQWLDFSSKGYMMSKPIDNQCKYSTIMMVMLRAVTAVCFKTQTLITDNIDNKCEN